MIHFKSSYSFNILVRLIIVTALLVVLIFFNSDYIQNVYLKNQLTSTGYIINGSIIGIFLLGMTKLVRSLLFYWREERAVGAFIINIHHDNLTHNETIDNNSLIYHRYITMRNLHRQHAEINQSAMAATMIASESIRLSLPKFIANILILTGVFGTIISLSIALLGASNLMEDNGIASMGQVIHGMSTALSTTTTAIICYFLFGYFYLKLMDIQTNLFSAIEQITTQYLLPHFSYQTETMVHQMADTIQLLNQTTTKMQLSQQQYIEMSAKINNIVLDHDSRMGQIAEDVGALKELLRQGFRLPEGSLAMTELKSEPQQDSSIENLETQEKQNSHSRMDSFVHSVSQSEKE